MLATNTKHLTLRMVFTYVWHTKQYHLEPEDPLVDESDSDDESELDNDDDELSLSDELDPELDRDFLLQSFQRSAFNTAK